MRAERLAWLSLACLGAFDLLVVALHLLDRELDPIVQAISEYALGQYGWILVIALLLFGLGILLLAAAVWLGLTDPRPVVGLAFLVMAGVGPIVAAVFRTDPVDLRDPGATELTASGTLHLIGFALAVLGIIVAAPIISRRLDARFRARSIVMRVMGWTPLLAVVVFWATGMWDDALGSLFDRVSVQGLAERLMVLIVQIWLVVAAIAVIRLDRRSTASAVLTEDT